MDNLYCVSLGSSMCEEWIKNAPQNSESLMLLPSSFLLHQARKVATEALHKITFLSFDELVNDIVKQYCEIIFIDRFTQEMLVEQVLAELSGEDQLPYFNTIASFPGYISTVTSLIGEIKRTGTSVEQFSSVCEARDYPQKDVEIYLIYKRYQEKLAQLKIADLEEMYLLAIRALEQGLQLPYHTIYISEFYVLTPLQREIIRQLRARVAVDIAITYEKNTPFPYKAVEATYTDLVGMGFNPIFKSTPENLLDKKIISCPNRQKEMRVVASRVKELLLTGLYSVDDIALVARDTAAYQDIFAVFKEFGIPLDMPQQENLRNQPLVRLIVNLLTAKNDGGTKESVLNILKSPYITAKFAFDIDYLEDFLLEHLIFDWQDWQKVLGQLPDNEEKPKIVAAFYVLSQTISHIPGKASCAEFIHIIKAFIDKLAVPQALAHSYQQGLPLIMLKAGLLTYQEVLSALERIENDYTILGQHDKLILTGDFLEGFIHLMQAEICIESRDSSGVKLISPSSVRGVKFSVVVVMGLSDGEFPMRERENWLYKDGERRLLNDLGMDISTLEQKRQIEDLYFNIALALAGDKLFLTYYEDEKTLPSPYIEQIREKNPIPVEKFSLDEILNKNYLQIYSQNELVNSVLNDSFNRATPLTSEQCTVLSLVKDWEPQDFWRKENAEGQRQNEYGEYSGVLGPDIIGKLLGKDKVYSISSLEDYASCPFSYFAGRVLGLDEFAEKEEDTGSDVVGNIYHEVAARFLSNHRNEKLNKHQSDVYHVELNQLILAAIASVEKQTLVKGRLWKFEKNKVIQSLNRWLDFEISEQNQEEVAFRPKYLEWGFGVKDYGKTIDPESTPNPLEVDLADRKVKIIGKIDRIDAAGDHLYRVFDYKKKNCRSSKEIKDGLDLQIPLYLWAVQQHLCAADDKIAGGGYYSIEKTKKAGGMWLKKDEQEWQDLNHTVKNYLKLYTQGIDNCDYRVAPVICSAYCIARGICRYNKHSLAKATAEVKVNE